MKKAVMLAIGAYKNYVSPGLPQACRFHPSCSQYAFEAVEKHGTTKGLMLAAKRVLKCHPYNPGGYDPVP